MRHLGLFEGIGGFALAARWMGWKTIAWVEKEPYCQKVLQKQFPNAEGYGDIKDFDGTKYRGKIDLITGGFPCQPFSVAGRRKGTSDERYLWQEMLRVIREVRPAWVVGENVFGLLSMENGATLERICLDLESEGYAVQPIVIPACAVQAPHRRDRIWIIAHCQSEQSSGGLQRKSGKSEQRQFGGSTEQTPLADHESRINGKHHREPKKRQTSELGKGDGKGIDSHTNRIRQQRQGQSGGFVCSKTTAKGKDPRIIHDPQFKRTWLEVATQFCRVDDGLSNQLDGVGRISAQPKKKKQAGRSHRLKALGNAIVPQAAYEIFRILEKYEQQLFSK